MTLQPLWRSDQLRALDARALADLPWLMEVAGAGLADGVMRELAAQSLDSNAQIELWIGPGNNGGDGLVAYRHLEELGLSVSVWTPLGLPSQEEGAAALQQLSDSGVVLEPLDAAYGSQPDLIVDCLFGIGLSRPLSGALLEVARLRSTRSVPVVACDVPSGLCADTGRVLGAAIRADRTVTFGGLKAGFFCSDGLDYCGQINLTSLGYRRDHYDHVKPIAQLDLRPAQRFLKPRGRADHKGRFGRVLALAGSPGLEGAAMLTMLGARCGGAGLLHLWSPELERPALVGLPAEVMVAPFREHALEAAERSDAIVAGPGLGRGAVSRKALISLLEAAPEVPWVLDADALYLLAEEPFELPARCLLTPHEGEALRLVGEDPLVGVWGGDRFALVEAIEARYGAQVLLKGAGNLLRVSEETYLVPGSARSLARGGSGDVLAGLIGALVGRGHTLEQAVHLGLRLQLAAARRFDPAQAETLSQHDLTLAITQGWHELHGA